MSPSLLSPSADAGRAAAFLHSVRGFRPSGFRAMAGARFGYSCMGCKAAGSGDSVSQARTISLKRAGSFMFQLCC